MSWTEFRLITNTVLYNKSEAGGLIRFVRLTGGCVEINTQHWGWAGHHTSTWRPIITEQTDWVNEWVSELFVTQQESNYFIYHPGVQPQLSLREPIFSQGQIKALSWTCSKVLHAQISFLKNLWPSNVRLLWCRWLGWLFLLHDVPQRWHQGRAARDTER